MNSRNSPSRRRNAGSAPSLWISRARMARMVCMLSRCCARSSKSVRPRSTTGSRYRSTARSPTPRRAEAGLQTPRPVRRSSRRAICVGWWPASMSRPGSPDSMALRAQALRLVVPQDAVVTDRTAGWLHGAQWSWHPATTWWSLRSRCSSTGRGARLRNELASSGQRIAAATRRHGGVRGAGHERPAHGVRPGSAAHVVIVRSPRWTRCSRWVFSMRTSSGRRSSDSAGCAACVSCAASPHSRTAGPSRPAESITATALAGPADAPAAPEPQIEVQRPGQPSYWLDLGVRGASLRRGVRRRGVASSDARTAGT